MFCKKTITNLKNGINSSTNLAQKNTVLVHYNKHMFEKQSERKRKMENEKSKNDVNGFAKQIGTTIYQVNVFFDEQATLGFEEKMWRLISNDMTYAQK